MAPMLRRMHGDTVLWAGEDDASAAELTRCMVRSQVQLISHEPPASPSLPAVIADLEELPFAPNSLDGIVLHHALERVRDPRIALREVVRVLAPGGRALICGFNPLSLVGFRRVYARFFDDALSDRRLVNPLRLFDWLTLLGLELQAKPMYCGYLLPRLSRRLRFIDERAAEQPNCPPPARLPFGGLLIVDVIKQANAHRLQWPQSKRERQLAPVAYPRVASWQRGKS